MLSHLFFRASLNVILPRIVRTCQENTFTLICIHGLPELFLFQPLTDHQKASSDPRRWQMTLGGPGKIKMQRGGTGVFLKVVGHQNKSCALSQRGHTITS